MPNRILRDWTDSISINKLSFFEETLFIRLIMKADDFGRFYGDADIVRNLAYPRQSNVSELQTKNGLINLFKLNLISLYQIDGVNYLQINNFGQRLRIMKSQFPEMTADGGQMTAVCLSETKRNEVETEVEVETETETNSLRQFVDSLNKIFNRNFQPIKKLQPAFNARTKEGYSIQNLICAAENASRDKFHIENRYKDCTPEFFLRADKLEKWLNAPAKVEIIKPTQQDMAEQRFKEKFPDEQTPNRTW